MQKLSSGAPLRALFQPRLSQFQAAFDDAMAEAVDSVVASTAAGGGNVLLAPLVAVVYAGEVLHSTGEWLLADSTFSGEQLHMWLDPEAAAVSEIRPKLNMYKCFFMAQDVPSVGD